MKVKNIDIITSPDDSNRLRLVAEVIYDNKEFKPELYWFEVDKKYKDYINTSGNPWLVCLIPLAVTIGEPLQLYNPIDAKLLENIKKLMQIWKGWYPNLHIIPIEAPVINFAGKREHKKTAVFFSGGVDSFFTVLRHNNIDSKSDIHIDDLICIWGLDIPLANPDAFSRMQKSLGKVAGKIGVELMPIVTNIRENRLESSGWGRLYFGSALASAALVLENRYDRVLIASGGEGFALPSWGSHPITDPLYSTEKVQVIYDSLEYTRLGKIRFIGNFRVAQKYLRVCWQGRSDKNCCACPKCYRTMTTLSALGMLDKFITFRADLFDTVKASRIYIRGLDKIFFKEILSIAIKNNKRDIVKAIKRSFRYSRILNYSLPVAKKLRSYLKTKRFFWRWASLLEDILLKNSIS